MKKELTDKEKLELAAYAALWFIVFLFGTGILSLD